MGRCVLAYLAVFMVGWLAIAVTGPRTLKAGSDSFEHASFGESMLSYCGTAIGMLVLIGIPSVLIALVAGVTRRKMEHQEFRALMAGMLLLPVWPLLFAGTPLILWIQIGVQVVFALTLMPVPLLPAPTVLSTRR
ncbi:hypothetical protein GCM10010315_23130 [Streptomyces luteosporeus]|uniref:Uncharacterized protein n=1 Tax=Streptomyces luteosporeus TaxID=173856 RepID=A0ABN3TQG0_9ACTN